MRAGDKIAALFAAFVCDELRALEIEPALSVACVQVTPSASPAAYPAAQSKHRHTPPARPQTAYANGASGAHLRSLGVPTPLARTGVKHVHHAALRYDVSVYFEAPFTAARAAAARRAANSAAPSRQRA